MSKVDLSCIIPAYNEEACLKESLRELFNVLDAAHISYEVIVIDNGSIDATGTILKELSPVYPQLRSFRLEVNQGYGGAIMHGFARAQGEVLGFISADGETAPESVLQVFRIIRLGGIDLCKAKRLNRQDGALRKLFSFGYHLVVSLVFKLSTTDINGYPLFMTAESYRRMRLSRKDWMINLQILYQARCLGLTSVELDVRHRRRLGGASHIRWFTSLVMLCQIFSMRLTERFKPE
jgi:glycosyltransferase involved in cell wall biosynthesis